MSEPKPAYTERTIRSIKNIFLTVRQETVYTSAFPAIANCQLFDTLKELFDWFETEKKPNNWLSLQQACTNVQKIKV